MRQGAKRSSADEAQEFRVLVTHQGEQPLLYGEHEVLSVEEHGTWRDGILTGTLTFQTVSTKHRNLSFFLHCMAPWGEISHSVPIEVRTSRKRISSLEDPLPAGRPELDRADRANPLPETAQPELPPPACDFLFVEPILDIVTSIKNARDSYGAAHGAEVFRIVRDEWLEAVRGTLSALEPLLSWNELNERPHEVWRENIRHLRQFYSNSGKAEPSGNSIHPGMHSPYEGGSGLKCTGVPAVEKLLTNRSYHYQLELKETEDTAILSTLRAGDQLQCHLMGISESSDVCSYYLCPLPNPLCMIPAAASSSVSPVTDLGLSGASEETRWDREQVDDENALWMALQTWHSD